MSGWISIDASPQPLTEGEQRVKDLLDQGYGYVYIAALLRMSHETTIEEIQKDLDDLKAWQEAHR